MSAIEQYINRISNAELQQQLREEIERFAENKVVSEGQKRWTKYRIKT